MKILADHRTIRLFTYATGFIVSAIAVAAGFATIDDVNGWLEKIPAIVGIIVSLLAAANITPQSWPAPHSRPDPTAEYVERLRKELEK